MEPPVSLPGLQDNSVFRQARSKATAMLAQVHLVQAQLYMNTSRQAIYEAA